MNFEIGPETIERENRKLVDANLEDYDALALQLGRRGLAIEPLLRQVADFAVAIPTWGVGSGGTRFARFPGMGEPRGVFDKIDDCAVIHALTRATPTVSPHFPWDRVEDAAALRAYAAERGLTFDAVNSNTFQDQPGQPHSYKHGSLCHVSAQVRAQAVAHNIECVRLGKALGSKALTVWIADGANFAGQSNLTHAFDLYLDSMQAIVAALPDDWQVFIEHKMFEPAFYATVIADWGTSLMAAQILGPKATCLVDLGHHAPNTNIEQIVARLIKARKLGGFHFNDSRYGDDDLDSGSIDPFRLFLVFNELVDAAHRAPPPAPAYMIDQSHNVTDPIESLINSAVELQRAYAQALLVDRAALSDLQDQCDALGAHRLLKQAFTTDVSPLLATARLRGGGAIDPIAVYRAAGYRAAKGRERPASGAASAGIV